MASIKDRSHGKYLREVYYLASYLFDEADDHIIWSQFVESEERKLKEHMNSRGEDILY